MASYYLSNGDSHVSLLPVSKDRFGDTDFNRPHTLLNSVNWEQVATDREHKSILEYLVEKVYGGHGALHSKRYST